MIGFGGNEELPQSALRVDITRVMEKTLNPVTDTPPHGLGYNHISLWTVVASEYQSMTTTTFWSSTRMMRSSLSDIFSAAAELCFGRGEGKEGEGGTLA